MEPNNIEKQIKEKLDNRTIQPSAQAWDRLDAMLTVAENEKSKRKFSWIHIAASFLGFILIGTIFFSQTEEIIDIKKNEVGVENKTVEKVQEPIIEKATDVIPKQTIAESAIARTDSKPTKTETFFSEENKKMPVSEQSKENSIINQKTEQQSIALNSTDNKDKPVSIEDKIREKNFQDKKSTLKVDAASLLAQVDGELDLSFREKVIKTAGKKYKTVKEAFATRNLNE